MRATLDGQQTVRNVEPGPIESGAWARQNTLKQGMELRRLLQTDDQIPENSKYPPVERRRNKTEEGGAS